MKEVGRLFAMLGQEKAFEHRDIFSLISCSSRCPASDGGSSYIIKENHLITF